MIGYLRICYKCQSDKSKCSLIHKVTNHNDIINKNFVIEEYCENHNPGKLLLNYPLSWTKRKNPTIVNLKVGILLLILIPPNLRVIQ